MAGNLFVGTLLGKINHDEDLGAIFEDFTHPLASRHSPNPIERRRVDEIDAQLDRTPQNFLRVLAIRQPTPEPLARQPHRPNPSRLTNTSPPNKNVSWLLLVLALAA